MLASLFNKRNVRLVVFKNIFEMFNYWAERVSKIHGDDVHANQPVGVLLREPAGELAKLVLLMPVYHLLGQTKKTTALGFYFYQHNRLLVFRENIDFSKGEFDIPVEDTILLIL